MDETKELWTRELNTEIQNASLLEDGSEVKARHINCINQMYKTQIEQARLEAEIEAKKAEMEAQKKDRKISHIIDGASIGVPLAAYIVMYFKGLKFEETGIVKSNTVRNLINRFRFLK